MIPNVPASVSASAIIDALLALGDRAFTAGEESVTAADVAAGLANFEGADGLHGDFWSAAEAAAIEYAANAHRA